VLELWLIMSRNIRRAADIANFIRQVAVVIRPFAVSTAAVCYAVRIARGKRHETVGCPSVRLSVCPVDRQQQRRRPAAGLLLRSGAGSRCRSAGHAGRINLGPTIRRSDIVVVRGLVVNFDLGGTVSET